MHKKLYYHMTGGGAEYLTDRWMRNPDGSKEGVFKDAQIIVRIDGNISKDAEITLADELFAPNAEHDPRAIASRGPCSCSTGGDQ